MYYVTTFNQAGQEGQTPNSGNRCTTTLFKKNSSKNIKIQPCLSTFKRGLFFSCNWKP